MIENDLGDESRLSLTINRKPIASGKNGTGSDMRQDHNRKKANTKLNYNPTKSFERKFLILPL